ncbi:ADP-ribosylglycohydrolase family protein [Spongiimicrobium salis]|uniref:ADP-ribosylglycohydrolase family protein n=1 Tax=Spongiimicrobium salis TaxID=1667022 RepID=UPI00374D60C5
MKYRILPLLFFLLFSCRDASSPTIPTPQKSSYAATPLKLDKATYYDKVLGALVGSAIGDAMGASTEMWNRYDIQKQYGYILGLTPTIRERSPEGPWGHNLVAGATTDDTRWKYLATKYVVQHKNDLNAKHFADFIVDYYQSLLPQLADDDALSNPDMLDQQLKKVDWIKEWVRVALAYQKGPKAYQEAQNRFYGGEMSCAGMLYTPMFGLWASDPERAYNIAYEHTLFDLGYARDISGIVAAMCNTALKTKDMDTILQAAIFVDPKGYQDSRLISRLSYSIADAAQKTVIASKEININDSLLVNDPSAIIDADYLLDSIPPKIPKGYQGTSLQWVQQEFVYRVLEKNQKAIAFHAGEIWEILYSALVFGEGDFKKTMQFIVNYGRDNDTVAAVAGMILGAKDGYSKLPTTLKQEVLLVNKEVLGIDLEALAKEMTDAITEE